jgi:HD-GYP domain-containing protein (c-di-GMP phosphodiesterase class II)
MEALIQVMESTIAARDPYTVGHQQRVTRIACAIAEEMGLSEDRINELRIAGTLHDLGKIAIPTELLSRSGKLSSVEFALIKTHPQVAYNILKPIKFPGNTAEIILQHHERLDGSGYPQGLKGAAILLEARILSVADVMDAMCAHRPYRASLSLGEALEELSSNKGILYDAAVVETCLKLYGQDLPASGAETSGLPLKADTKFRPRVSPRHFAQSHGNFVQVSAWPQAKRDQGRRWAKGLAKGPRAWMHMGTASFMGFLIMSSIRGI